MKVKTNNINKLLKTKLLYKEVWTLKLSVSMVTLEYGYETKFIVSGIELVEKWVERECGTSSSEHL